MKKIKLFFWLLNNLHNMDEATIGTDASGVAYIKTYYPQVELKIKYVLYREVVIQDGK